jgi:predicted RNase H-like HicB family nuclease
MSVIHTFSASIHKENDYYIANCIEIGTVSQGSTIEEALANLKEATELYLEEFPQENHISSTFITTFNTVSNG